MFNWNDKGYWVEGTTNNQKIKAIIQDILFIITGIIVYGGSIGLLIYLTFK